MGRRAHLPRQPMPSDEPHRLRSKPIMSDHTHLPDPHRLLTPDVKRRGFALWPFLIGVVIVGAFVAGGWYLLKHRPAAQASEGFRPGRGGPGGPGAGGGPGGGKGFAMVVAVEAARAHLGDVPVITNALGTVTSLASVTVKTQIYGTLTGVHFAEGQFVKQDQLLAQIDSRPYLATLHQDQGQLEHDTALLNNAQLDLKRYVKLVSQDSIAEQQLDTQKALVLQYQGQVDTDKAQIETAKLNLGYCSITAPVAGRLGMRQVDPGNIVQTSDTNGIVVVTQIDPISVLFSIPEDSLPAVEQQLASGRTLTVTAYDRSKTTVLGHGKVVALDNLIDTTTGMVKLRAVFRNEHNLLFPNQFVNIELLVDTVTDALIVPSASIQRGAPGIFVYLVDDKSGDATVSIQVVTLGPVDGETTSVTSGLKVGDVVVTQGADRLKDGSDVEVHTAADIPGAGPATPHHGHRHHHPPSDTPGGDSATASHVADGSAAGAADAPQHHADAKPASQQTP